MVTRQQFHGNKGPTPNNQLNQTSQDPFAPRPPRKPRRGMRRGTRNRIIALILLLLLIGGGVYGFQKVFMTDPYVALNPEDKKKRIIEIPSGATTADMGNLLAEKEIIADGQTFVKYAIENDVTNLQAGDYALAPSQDMASIFKTMQNGPDTRLKRVAFIEELAPYAQKMQDEYGVLPSINLAQTILESEWGESRLAAEYNNYYGIKAQGDQKSVTLPTKEFTDEGEWVTINDAFAVYDSWEAGMEEHAKFLKNGTTLKPGVFDNVIAAKDYKEAARALVVSGYATDPTYEDKIIEVIETWDLAKYDQ